MCLADGKRSRAQQQATYDDYVAQYGQAMADQYVLPPEKSAHVLGLAIDVQPYAGLHLAGGAPTARSGCCRIYDNEAWHFEYDPAFATAGCPARLRPPRRLSPQHGQSRCDDQERSTGAGSVGSSDRPATCRW